MRNRIRKTNIGQFSDEQMERAVKLVFEERLSLRRAADECNVSFVTLYRYVKKQKTAHDNGCDEKIRFTPKYQSRLIFTAEQEKLLSEYLLTCSKMCYGKSTRDTRELAYEMAMINGINVPPSWHTTSTAGLDWLRGFLKRNPTLSKRQPEKCSLSRCTSFNRHTVNTFYDNMEEALQRSTSFADGSRIWNLDETATSTVVNKSVKVIAEKGSREGSTVAAGEKGTLVTTCCYISASGNTIAPVLVFPRVKFKDHMLINAPPGSLGLATKSGWMTADVFSQVIKHFVKHTLSSKENPTLLIMDNHHSHICIEVINLAKENGITIVTLPPHCSAKLQPLDVSCYAPFKTYYAAAVDSWQKQNPGKVFSIYNIAGCVNEAHQKSMIPTTIINGFKKTGIFPFNRNLFTEADFLSSFVTDRPNPIPSTEPEMIDHINVAGPSSPLQSNEEPSLNEFDLSAGILQNANEMETTGKKTFKSPAEFKGYPKAGPRKMIVKKRKSGRSMIATDTPEKNLIEEAARQMAAKNSKISIPNKKQQQKQQVTKNLFVEESSDDSDLLDQWSATSSSGGSFEADVEQENAIDLSFTPLESVQAGEFVLVEFRDKKKIYYVGQVTKEKNDEGEVEISFLRKSSKVPRAFCYPQVDDIAYVNIKDVKLKLPIPEHKKGTKRTQSFQIFPISFTNMDVR